MKKSGLSFSRKRKIAKMRKVLGEPISRTFLQRRFFRQVAILCADLMVIPFAFVLAVIFRYGGAIHQFQWADVIAAVVTVIGSALIFRHLGFYRAIIRYMGQQAVIKIVQGVGLSGLLLSVACFLTKSQVPASTPVIYSGILLLLIGGGRLLIRLYYQQTMKVNQESVLIYGAGGSGRQLLTALLQTDDYSVVALIDDNKSLWNSVIHGVPVYGSKDIPDLIDQFSVAYIFLAMPSVTRYRRQMVINRLEQYPVRVKTVPEFNALVTGQASVEQVQDIDIIDLLAREPVPPKPLLLERCNRDKVVMVTGAGGSIGSELCRQILKTQPKELILMDTSEYSLYEVSRELGTYDKDYGEANIYPLIGSVRDEERLQRIFTEFKVDTVYHAAAYKHVPMVEYNMAEGVANNVFGTLSVARACALKKVENFVLISTDKAVRPTNIMGASKRLSELIVQACAKKYPATRFSMVRFGNVLGSSGSVVPLFREQILAGGPLTVTHKDITRFFMTIPEAAQLVLQAGAMAKGGDVFVLDMGDPVKIDELAKRMVRLLGFSVRDTENPEGEIAINYTGLRPGEKLYEELLVGENVSGTGHPKIMRAEEDYIDEEKLDGYLTQLKQSCISNDCESIQAILYDVVDGFKSEDGISDKVWQRKQSNINEGKTNVVSASFKKPN